MSLSDKMRCAREGCNHPRYLHNGSHVKGHRTMCQRQVGESHLDKCQCPEFKEPELPKLNSAALFAGKQS